jgi:hypothetical protein
LLKEIAPLNNLPQSATYWFVFWVIYIISSFYLFFSSYGTFILIADLIGFAVLIATSASNKVRVWRKIAPPPDFMKEENKE